jgi:F420-non-reducing hydrogenase iron-sulfur subunit
MKGKTAISVFCCHNALYSGLEGKIEKAAAPAGMHKVETPCSGKVEPVHMLKAFENGADGVIVLACPPRQCNTIEGSARLEKRVARTKTLLAEAGLEPERLILLQAERPAARKLERILNEAAAAIGAVGASPIKSARH